MIKRVGDYSSLSDDDFDRILSVVKKRDDKRLFSVFKNEDDAKIAVAELRLKGYRTSLERMGDEYRVFYLLSESVPFDEAERSGQFKKLAWGRYCFQKQSGLGVFNYDFDDGSIWRVATDEDGNLILVKEIDDDDPEVVIRDKRKVKVAHSDSIGIRYVTDSSLRTALGLLYNDHPSDAFIDDVRGLDVHVKEALYSTLDSKLDSVINGRLMELGIDDETTIDEVKRLVATALVTTNVSDTGSFDRLIIAVAKSQLNEVGRQRRYFE